MRYCRALYKAKANNAKSKEQLCLMRLFQPHTQWQLSRLNNGLAYLYSFPIDT